MWNEGILRTLTTEVTFVEHADRSPARDTVYVPFSQPGMPFLGSALEVEGMSV